MSCHLKVQRITPDAIMIGKGHVSDSGLDVTIIGVHKVISPNITMYKTGLRLQPDEGYYTKLYARSSLMKYGCMLANNVAIIDESYRGELLVVLYHFENTGQELTLPAKVAQLVVEKRIDVNVVEVDSLDETVRGSGGFGSTGK